MVTYFGKPEVQYNLLNDDGDIAIEDFLRSCEGIVEFVSFLGKAFVLVKNDISGNVDKVKRIYVTDPVKYASIMKFLDSESAKSPGKVSTGTDALMWLKRALEFICLFLEALVSTYRSGQTSDSLVEVSQDAYDKTLKKNHNMIQKGLFSHTKSGVYVLDWIHGLIQPNVIIHATPWRKDFMQTMAFGRPDAEGECVADLERYLPSMRANVNALMDTFHRRGIEKYDSTVNN